MKKKPPPTIPSDSQHKFQSFEYTMFPASSNLTESKYVGLYKEYSGFLLPEYAKAKETIRSSAQEFLYKYLKHHIVTDDFDNVAMHAVKMYTSQFHYGFNGSPTSSSNRFFFQFMNTAIYNDHFEQLERLMPLVRIINYYLSKDPQKKHTSGMTVYRGCKLTKDKINMFLDKFKPGSELRFATYLSTTKDPLIAGGFGGECTHMFEIDVPPHAKAPHYRDISDISMYPNEQEVLFVPYSKFAVVSVDTTRVVHGKSINVIRLRAMDNLNQNNPKQQAPISYQQVTVAKKKAPLTHSF